jgi:acyl-CoA synthetase (AMP-forming)/AMP-acid ligase II
MISSFFEFVRHLSWRVFILECVADFGLDKCTDDFAHMRTGIMAGSPCPIPVMRDVVDKMHMTEITTVFGQTDSSPDLTMSSTGGSLELRVTTVGRALPQIECEIVDQETGAICLARKRASLWRAAIS